MEIYLQAIGTGLLVLGVLYWAYRSQRGNPPPTTRLGGKPEQPPSNTNVEQ
jgi:hypothetical protein